MKTPRSSLRCPAGAAALMAVMLAASSPLNAAGTFTWTGAGASSAWSNTANWNGTVTSDNQTDLIFDSTTRTLATSGNGSYLGGNRIARSLTYTANINAGVATSFNFFNSTTPETLTMSAATGNASITVNSGATGGITLGQASGVGSNVGNFVLASNLDVIHNGSGQLTINTATTGTGFGINKSGTGTLLLNSASSYTGATTITGGTFLVNLFANGGTNSGMGAASNAATNLVIDGGTLKFGGSASSSTDRLFSLGANGGTLDASGSAGFAVSFTNTGSIGFNGVAGARTLTLTGSNVSGNAVAALIADNGGATSVTKTGAGSWTLSNANTYSGPTTLGAGFLRVGASSVGSVGNVTSGPIGVGTLVLNGGTMSSDSTTARTLLNAVTFGGDVGFGSSVNTGSLIFSAAADLGGATRTLTVATGSLAQFDGVVSNGGLTKAGAGTLALTGANTYTGATTVNAGTLALGASNVLAAGTAVTLGGGTLNLGGFSQAAFTNALTMTAASTVDFGTHVAGLTLKFADSSAATWTGSLSLLNFTAGTDNLSFTSVSGLTVGQLNQISLAGYTATGLDSSGNVQFAVSAVPEPSAYAAIFGALSLMGAIACRRRSAGV